jgi:phosphatidylserine decarboxylase
MAKQSNYYPHPIIAREGWFFIALISVVAWFVVSFLSSAVLSVFVLICWVLVVQFFRDPPRRLPENPSDIVSPADGRIVAIEQAEDPFTHEARVKISVFMNVFNVHSNRIPVEGFVKQIQYHSGSFLNAALSKASLANERNAMLIETTDGKTITCVQIAGLVARRILCYVKPNDVVLRGMRYGFIRFGSRVDVYLPPSVVVNVAIGQKVCATETVLARWR